MLDDHHYDFQSIYHFFYPYIQQNTYHLLQGHQWAINNNIKMPYSLLEI